MEDMSDVETRIETLSSGVKIRVQTLTSEQFARLRRIHEANKANAPPAQPEPRWQREGF